MFTVPQLSFGTSVRPLPTMSSGMRLHARVSLHISVLMDSDWVIRGQMYEMYERADPRLAAAISGAMSPADLLQGRSSGVMPEEVIIVGAYIPPYMRLAQTVLPVLFFQRVQRRRLA